MFCTTLRRRNSFASILPNLVSPSTLGLRENELTTHDVALYIGPKSGPNPRQLRVLLLSPSTVTEGKLDSTIERVQHLIYLTGGQDLAIVFLLTPPAETRFTSVKVLNSNSHGDRGTEGMLAYTKLQASLTHPELAGSVPILPLPTLEGLPGLLQKHLAALSGVSPSIQVPTTTPFELLRLSALNAPLRQETAFLLTDLFGGLGELAEGCCHALRSVQETSSPSFVDPMADHGREEGAMEKLERLKAMMGEAACEDVVLFWREEYTVE